MKHWNEAPGSFPVIGSRLAAQQNTTDLRTFDYSKADSIALHIPKKKFKTTEELALALTQDLYTEHEKFRAIFRWITANVQYSYSNRKEDAKKAMNGRKAVCIGYSTLLKELCGTAGINCRIITGDARTEIADIGRKFNPNHAWNAVFLNGGWYLADVTWASGYFDEKKRKFTRTFKEFYFLTPPSDFVATHFPDEKKWQLLANPVRFRKYSRAPIKPIAFFSVVSDSFHVKGKLRALRSGPLEITIPLKKAPESVVLEIGEKNFLNPVVTDLGDGSYLIAQPVTRKGKFDLTVYIDGRAVSGHKLVVR